MSETEPDKLVVAKTATPLVLGLGDGENFVASDIPAILEHTRRALVLEDGELAEITAHSVALFAFDGTPVDGPPGKSNGMRSPRPRPAISIICARKSTSSRKHGSIR